MQRKGKSYTVFSASLLLLGILLMLLGILFNAALPRETRNWDKTVGIITGFKRIEGWEEGVAPIVEYMVDNKNYSVVSLVSYSGFIGPKVGTKKEIRYNPHDPSDSFVVENFTPYRLINYFTIFAGFLLVLSAIYNYSHFEKNC